ncbi:MAG: hypothetical protein A2033_17870 [Bacteroidetes bacterium GWA2_31_9]|nr:MAG: hypothetical protein A2033_17870 [Bacteroidetes bacterium GWA2_31_9]
MFRKLLLVLFVILANCSFAQPPLPAPSGHMVIRQGGNVVFNFSALKRYTTGMTLADWTVIDIFYDSDGGGTSWKLSLKANSAQIDGDMGNNLNLDVIEITASDGGGVNPLGAFCEPKITLTSLDQDLVVDQGLGGPPDGVAAGDNLINLTYECGVTNSVLGQPADFYVVDLVVTLYED